MIRDVAVKSVAFLIFIAYWVCPQVRAADAAAKLNIVFILTDDQRFDALGAVGNTDIHTPNLDKFAASGVVFTHATVVCPMCAPSRAAMLTGLTTHQDGYYSNKAWSKDVDHQFRTTTALQYLEQNGYRTTLIGKWHVTEEPWRCGVTETRVWMPHGGDAYENPKLAHGASSKIKEVAGHVTEIFTRDAVSFLNESAQRRNHSIDQGQAPAPFFLWLAYTAPHTPQKPVPQRAHEPYLTMAADRRPPGFPPAETTVAPWEQYYSAITHLDEQIGLVLKAIDDNGFRDNTMVVFFSDNGWMMGSHGYFGKIIPEDESIRVPLVIRAPAGTMGWIGKTDALASSLDLPPTWLSAAGIKVPESWPGRSLLPLLRDQTPATPFRDDVFCEFEEEKNWPGLSFRVVRTHDWKYVLRPPLTGKDMKSLTKYFAKDMEKHPTRKPPELEHEQLFDLKNDPYELHDVIGSPDAQAAVKDLRARMQAWMEQTRDPAIKWLNE